MVFSAVGFLFFFLPAVLGAYYVAPRRVRNAVLLIASLIFYTWGAGAFVLALLASIGFNYIIGLIVERAQDAGDERRARLALAVGVTGDVALLAIFKYTDFALGSWNAVLSGVGIPTLPLPGFLLPIGISFFTFHAISYIVDIYRGAARHLVAPVDFALYIAFFPQLVAGPIVRFHEIRDQLVRRRETEGAFTAGIYRFSLGLGKKVLIADTVAPIADAIFATPTDQLATGTAILGAIAYAVQLYFDFSGYSDMALGLALMFGIRLPENFARPYASRSITEFWRRWHMSLSRWFRDYLYIPLGGNRGTPLQTYRNLIIVFLVTGLWHGANWTFVVWGMYHGVLLLIERATGFGRDRRPAAPWQLVAVTLVLLGWVFFRSPDLGYAIGYFQAFLRPGAGLTADIRFALDPLAAIALVFGAASALIPASWVTGVRLEDPGPTAQRVLRLSMVAVVLPVSLIFVMASTFSPFLYFQF
jgi:alginate O-acetyltransferase complex protein AlgI